MIKQLTAGLAGICIMLTFSASGFAQEMMEAKKMENQTWHQVVLVKYKPGTIDQVQEIIDKHFAKAGMEAKVPGPDIMRFRTGEWDMMFVWTMDSLSDMNWEVHPDDAKWWNALVKQEGSAEKAQEVMQKYMGFIESSTSYLATTRNEMGGESMGDNRNN